MKIPAQPVQSVTKADNQSRSMIWLVAALLSLQPLSTDLYLPGLSGLQMEMQSTAEQVRFSLTALLLCFGLSQLLWGWLARHFHRHHILTAGLLLHASGALLAVLAPELFWVIAGRCLQGIGLGAIIISARALIQDFDPHTGTENLARSLVIVSLVATFTIPVGGLVVDYLGGWQAALLLPAILSAALCAGLALRALTSSNSERSADQKTRQFQAREAPIALFDLLRHPHFHRFTLLNGMTYATLIVLLGNTPLIFLPQGISPSLFGLAMCSMILGFSIGTWLCRHGLQRVGLANMLAIAAALNLGASVSYLLMAQKQDVGLVLYLAPGMLFMLAHGINHASAQGSVLKPFKGQSLQVSAMNGCGMMVLAFGIASLIPAPELQPHPLMYWIAGLALVTGGLSLWSRKLLVGLSNR